ncbi:SPOR domain-containing protein [Acidovorax lacteus]|uniref:SPOR domain-containing protein n=1 Tax=Acidovorax lacteus TaxID=1924988 RepID=A0ABP8KZC2_9BURK
MVFVPPTDAYAQASAAAQPSSSAAPDAPAATPAMTTLYGHAVGPLNTAYYLDVFDRLDGSGRSTVGWNWAAALCTLNWLIYRRLWNAALVYLAAAEGLALLVFGVGRPLLDWPAPVEWGVIGAFVLASIVVPGWYGNGLMYAEVRKRIDRALTASATVAEAGERLEREAPTRRRLQWIVAANAALALLAVLAALWWPKGPIPGASPQPEPRVWDGSGSAGPAPAASAAATAQAAAPESAASAAALPTSAAADTPASPPQAAAPAAQPLSQPASQPAQASAATETPQAAAPAPASAPASAPAATAAPPGPKASAPAPTASTPPSPQSRSTAREASAPESARPAARETARATERKASGPAPAASRDQALVPVGSAPGFYLNVGLFADEANARKAQARLLNEGLPAFRQELDTTQGRRIRVRVGPYATRAQAERAAASVRALSLEAVVFQKKH